MSGPGDITPPPAAPPPKGGGRRSRKALPAAVEPPPITAPAELGDHPPLPSLDAEFVQDEAERAALEQAASSTALVVRANRYKKGYVVLDEANRETFLAVLETAGSFQAAADAVGVDVKTAYNARKADAEFDAMCESARARYADSIRAEVRRRGVFGWVEPVFQGGTQVGLVRKYSDRLLELEAKRVDPAYRDKVALEHSGGIGITAGVLVVPPEEEDP